VVPRVFSDASKKVSKFETSLHDILSVPAAESGPRA
jgi:hypothetical protein